MSNQLSWVLLLFVVSILQSCNQPASNSSTTDATLAVDSTRGGVTVIIEDLDPSLVRSTNDPTMIITQDKLQSTIPDSSKVIILNNNNISTSSIYKSGGNYFIQNDNGDNYSLVMEAGKSDTFRTGDLEIYYGVRAVMNGDTVRLFVPRARLIEMNNQ